MFYVQRSQHFNQSDFGVLFPWIAKRFTKAEEPERILELNNRAMVQMLREAGVELAGEQDNDILNAEPSIARWTPVQVEDEGQVQLTNTVSIDAVNRKLSVGSIKDDAAPRDGMTMGQKTQAQLEL